MAPRRLPKLVGVRAKMYLLKEMKHCRIRFLAGHDLH